MILSAEQAGLSADANAERTAMLARQLDARDLDFMPVTGSYKGAQEKAFLVLAAEDSPQWSCVMSLARRYWQESVLSVCGSRLATLHYLRIGGLPSCASQRLGKFREITADEAARRDAWTRVDETGIYWSACK